MMSYNKIILIVFIILPLFTGSMSVVGLQKAYAGDSQECVDDSDCGLFDACTFEMCDQGTFTCVSGVPGDPVPDCCSSDSQCQDIDACTPGVCDIVNNVCIAGPSNPECEIEIDIKPGSDPSCFNSNSIGTIPVAILGSASSDVNQIDPSTLELDDQPVKTNKKGKLLVNIEDINDDGIDDMVIKFRDKGAYSMSDTTATLTGLLLDGTPILGTTDICITQ